MKALIRDAIGEALAITGLTGPRRFGHGRLNIATFHRVLPEDQRCRYPYPMLAVTPEELGWFLDFFGRHFLCTTLAGALRLFESGARPERPLLAITFDDAQLDNFVHARPALEARRMRASFYAPVEAVERQTPLWHDRLGFGLLAAGESPSRVVEAAKTWTPQQRLERVEAIERKFGATIPDWARMMTWDQLSQLAEAGHEVGSHSMSHAILPQLSTPEIRREVVESKERIEATVGRPVETFCYPNGDADDRVASAVRRAGYVGAVTTTWGNNALGGDLFRLRRCDMNASYSRTAGGALSAARVAWRMSGLHPGL